MKIHCIPTGYLGTNTYLVFGNFENKDYVFLVDPAGNTENLKNLLALLITGLIIFIIFTYVYVLYYFLFW
mgnify:CR=1 FL=1